MAAGFIFDCGFLLPPPARRLARFMWIVGRNFGAKTDDSAKLAASVGRAALQMALCPSECFSLSQTLIQSHWSLSVAN